MVNGLGNKNARDRVRETRMRGIEFECKHKHANRMGCFRSMEKTTECTQMNCQMQFLF